MNILLVAEEAAGIQTLRQIKKSDHNLVALLTSSKAKSGVSNIASVARKLNVEVLPGRLVKDPDFTSWITANKVDTLINVHSLYVICSQILEALPHGAYNLHPGKLPAYAGLNAPSWAIYNGEAEHSVTLHRMDKNIDTGDIISEATFPLSPHDTGLSVSSKCVKKGLPLIDKLLDDLYHRPSKITGKSQDISKMNYYSRERVPGSGKICWNESAQKINAFIRASNYSPFSSPWGTPKTRLGNREISILNTELYAESCNNKPGSVARTANGKTAIATADFWLMVDRCVVDDQFVHAAKLLKPGDVLG